MVREARPKKKKICSSASRWHHFFLFFGSQWPAHPSGWARRGWLGPAEWGWVARSEPIGWCRWVVGGGSPTPSPALINALRGCRPPITALNGSPAPPDASSVGESGRLGAVCEPFSPPRPPITALIARLAHPAPSNASKSVGRSITALMPPRPPPRHRTKFSAKSHRERATAQVYRWWHFRLLTRTLTHLQDLAP